MDIRTAHKDDLLQLLELYTQLHTNTMPQRDEKLEKLWDSILADPNHYIVIGVVDGLIVSSCVLVIVPNLTQQQRPYAFIENVITHTNYRNRGYASEVLHFARDLAVQKKCYKIMLMTGSQVESTWRFYEQAGYNRTDKTAFIQWLD